MTGQPVDSVVVAEAGLPVPLAASGMQGGAFRPPEKRIHNQTDLNRHDTCHPAFLPAHRGDGHCHPDRTGQPCRNSAAEGSPPVHPCCSAESDISQYNVMQQCASSEGRIHFAALAGF